MSYKDYEPVDLARAGFQIHQLEALEKDNIENAFAGYVAEVIGPINDGKEATVYLCRGGEATDRPYLAAKMFKARVFRSFNTDRNYRNFGKHRDKRMAKAMSRKSKKGEVAFHKHWIDSEWRYLNLLFAAGVCVPKPYALSADGVLMEFIGDDNGPAPRLINTRLSPAEAEDCGRAVYRDVDRMLDLEVVHGDLSPYNILYDGRRPVIIDVPQAMEMHTTPDAFSMMLRDLTNLEHYFDKQGAPVPFVELLYRKFPGS
jgi:RIO kinase 1